MITRNWVEAIRTGSKMLAPGKEGINSLQISNAAYLSTWLDNWVDIPVDEELYYRKLQAVIKASDFQKTKAAEEVMNFEGTTNS
ncbi:MAG: hypothetical protein ABR497_03670 [Kiritimatiellia bacterium]